MIGGLSEYNKNVVTILLDSMIEKDRVEQLQDVKMKSRLSELNAIRKKNLIQISKSISNLYS